MLLFGFLLPYCIITLFYILIIYELNPKRHQLLTKSLSNRIQIKQVRRDIAAAKAALLLVLVFLLAWTPYALVYIFITLNVSVYEEIEKTYVRINMGY